MEEHLIVSNYTHAVSRNNSYQAAKRIIDVSFALIMLIMLSPFLLAIAALIRLTSRGPVLYSQTRVGLDGRPFTIFKFRSMRIDAPNLSTEEMQRRGLNPVTPVGALLRKTSVDELPQLINILLGEMSFIGPRPALPTQEDVNTLREKIGVHKARPGITGLAQVMGRDDLDTDTKVRYDAEYCCKMGLLIDLKLILMTVAAIVSSRGNK